MRKFIKITCVVMLMIYGISGCTAKFEEYNTDPYKIYNGPPEILFTKMIGAMMFVQQNDSQLIDQMVGSQGGYFAIANRWGGQNFDTFNASDGWNATPYNTMFDIYPNFFKIAKTTNSAGHFYMLARLIRAAVMIRVVDCYGPIPYGKASNGTFYVEYDSAEDVYKNIIKDLSEAATMLYAYSVEFPASHPLEGNDQLYDGDYAAWARLANSLCLRVAIRTNNSEAAQAACTHAAGLIESNAQNAMMGLGVQPNPYNLAASSWKELRANASIVDYMTGYEDPRLGSYFQKSSFDGARYIGMRSGEAGFQQAEVVKYSLPGMKPSSKLPVFVAAETNFLRAEAALKGWSFVGSAKDYYEAGVRLSMEQNGVLEESIISYVTNEVLVPDSHQKDPRGSKYDYTRTTDLKIKWNDGDSEAKKLERVITQKWIANYPMGLEAWADYRRTGYPDLAVAMDNLSSVVNTKLGMRRLRYPYTEKNLNRANYDKGVVLLGSADNESVDLFWAKKK